jgi:ComEC/Rec2-related protein
VRSVAVLPSLAVLAGVYAGIAWADDVAYAPQLLACLGLAAGAAWVCHASAAGLVVVTAGYAFVGIVLGAASARDALDPPLRAVLDATYGGFSLQAHGSAGPHDPVRTRARLVEDAAPRELGVALRAVVQAIEIDGEWRPASGGVRLTVSGSLAAQHASAWRAGRRIEAPVTFRRPAVYLNDGVPDFERDAALSGIALTGGVKSGLLVRVIAHGTRLEEAAADVRAHVRGAVTRWISSRDLVAGAIVTAILIGDRTLLPDEIRERLQAAGTYHVIAISGGNIAILAALLAGVLIVAGANGRASAAAIIAGLAAYAFVVSAGPSVWRATVTAVVYLAARLVDHRSPPWNAMAVSAALLGCVAPLDVRDVGFALTFGATAAILESARRVRWGAGPWTWIVGSVAASLAVEIVLLPIGASAFSRATVAGLVLNLAAVPLMTVAQVAGLVVVCLESIEPLCAVAGLVAAAAARGLVDSAGLVDLLPWMALRVPPPAPLLVALYYVALGAALWLPRGRAVSILVLTACAAAVWSGATTALGGDDLDEDVRLTMFDVGQGEALLLQVPGGPTVMVDSGGAGFDGSAFDIGGRVLAPALWAMRSPLPTATRITSGARWRSCATSGRGKSGKEFRCRAIPPRRRSRPPPLRRAPWCAAGWPAGAPARAASRFACSIHRRRIGNAHGCAMTTHSCSRCAMATLHSCSPATLVPRSNGRSCRHCVRRASAS